MKIDVKFLTDQPSMDKFISQKVDKFFSQFELLFYKKEEMIIPGKTPKGVFYLKKSLAKMSVFFEDGRELTLNIYKEGSYFPMLWALTEIPNSYYFQTIVSSQLYCAPKDKVIEFIKKNPDALFNLTTRILTGVNVLLNNIMHLLSGSVYSRVAAALLLCARRFGEKTGGKLAIKVPLTHQSIANLAGITMESASVAVLRLQEQKIIQRRHRVWLVEDITKLEKQLYIKDDESTFPQSL